MESALKQRLIGAAVLVALAMIFLPMLLKGPDPANQGAARVPLDAPAAPDAEFETREVPLALPAPTAPRGDAVLPPGDASTPVTVDPDAAAPRVDFDPDAPVEAPDEAPLAAVDPATGEPVVPEPPSTAGPDLAPVVETPVPAPAAPLPVTTAAGRYAVNVGTFSNLDNARALADRLRAAKLPVGTENVSVDGKPALRVRVGPYAERALAEAARLRVEGLSGGSAAVIALDGASPAAPAATGRAPAAASVGFAVQLGALSSEADANVLVGRAKSAGFVAFHQRVPTANGVVWRVRVGPEADRAAAQRLCDDVAGKLGIADAIVVSHP